MAEHTLYPLKFHPILKEKVWGGDKLHEIFKKEAKGNIGESWEISGVEESVSIISNGKFKGKTINWLLENYKEKLVGQKVYQRFGNTFPLLFKFIDAKDDLSVQLHPCDELAKKRHNSFGKTEMWYILDSDKDAKIILGFNGKMDQKKYLEFLSKGKITDILHSEQVKSGDAFLITPGVVHAICAGVLLAEIQQTSDITYRIYDWDRPDINGKMRDLHTDLALEALQFEDTHPKLNYSEKMNTPFHICTSEFFVTDKLVLDGNFKRNLNGIESFCAYMCLDGGAEIESGKNSIKISKGETVLIPAEIRDIKFNTNSAQLLEVYIP